MNCCSGDIYNLCIDQGATFTRIFVWFAPSCCPGTVGSTLRPVDITGYTARMQFRPYPLSTTVLYDASGDLVLGGVAGSVYLTIPAAVTAGFTWFTGVYDLLLTASNGYSTRLLSGQVNVSPQISTAS